MNVQLLNFCSYCPALFWRNVHLVIFCSMRPLVASEEKPKAFFLTEFMTFKLEYNSNFDNILVKKKSNLVFQPIWQPKYTVCMNVQWESSPYFLPVNIATVTKVKSKMATSIKLKVLSLSDMTRVQSSCEFFHQIFINSSLYIWVESGAFESRERAQNTKLTGAAPVENWRDLNLSDDTQLISQSLKVTENTWNHTPHSRRALVWRSVSLFPAVWRDRQLFVQSCSIHTARVFQECGCES